MIPAVTCTVQSTLVTGLPPSGHGVVANGWYFHDLSEVWLWRQSNRLVQHEKIWHVGRQRDASFTCANTFWWYAMATDADVSLTPRPLYCADGLKLPDFYADPPRAAGRIQPAVRHVSSLQLLGASYRHRVEQLDCQRRHGD